MAPKSVKSSNVPNLRFPGFSDPWIKAKLGDIAEKINSGKTPLGGESNYLTEGVLFVRSQNVNNDRLELENIVYISENVNAGMKNSVVRANDILLNITGASLGRSCVVPEDFEKGNVNQHVCIIRPRKQYNPRFIQPILGSTRGQAIFESLQTGSGREGLNFDSIKKIELDFPSLPEQEKIADFLSLIDRRIQTQNKIIQRLETLIKGLCQNLFKEGNDPSWSKFYLKSLLIERREFNIANYPVHSVSVSRGVINQIEYLGRSFAAKDTSNYNVVYNGDIIYTKSPTGEFPYGVIKQSFVNEKVAVSPLYGVYRPKNIYLANILHYYFSNPINTNNYLHSLVQKGAKNTINITNQDFLNKEIYLPSDENQIKTISLLLNSITKKIRAEQSLHDRLLQQKQYLLQNMFI